MGHDYDFSRRLVQKRPVNRLPQLAAQYAQTTVLGGKFAIIETCEPGIIQPKPHFRLEVDDRS